VTDFKDPRSYRCSCADAEKTYEELLQYCDEIARERDAARIEVDRLRGELAAVESTITALEDPELRAALTGPTTGDYGSVPPPQDVR
jgi:hypothetical protein